MGDAYGYAVGIAPQTHELRLLREIDRFGTQSIVGRVLYAGEIYRMHTVENIYLWFNERQEATGGYATWALTNREKANVLAIAEKNWMERNSTDG